jgi:hypothetical protein
VCDELANSLAPFELRSRFLTPAKTALLPVLLLVTMLDGALRVRPPPFFSFFPRLRTSTLPTLIQPSSARVSGHAPHAQLDIPETTHGPTLEYHQLPHGSSTHSLTRPARYTVDGLTGRLWNTSSCLTVSPPTPCEVSRPADARHRALGGAQHSMVQTTLSEGSSLSKLSLSPGKRLHHQRSSRHAMVPLSDTSPQRSAKFGISEGRGPAPRLRRVCSPAHLTAASAHPPHAYVGVGGGGVGGGSTHRAGRVCSGGTGRTP